MSKELRSALNRTNAVVCSHLLLLRSSVFIASVFTTVAFIGAGCAQDSVGDITPATQSDTPRTGVSSGMVEVIASGAPVEEQSPVMPLGNPVTADAEMPITADAEMPITAVEVTADQQTTLNLEVSAVEGLAAIADDVTVVVDKSITINILDNDTIPAGISGVTIDTNVGLQAMRGWLSVDQVAGTITYNPYNGAEPGTDQFGYKLWGGGEASNVTTVDVTLAPRLPPAGCEYAGSANRTFSLLLIGNSLMNEIEAKLRKLLVCKGYTTDFASSNPGGSFLHQHNSNARTTSLIAEGYDLTLIQEQSRGMAANNSPPYEVISRMKAKIEAAGSRMGFYQTWGRQNRDPVETESILSGYEEIAQYFGAPIVRIGRAWDYFYTSHNESPPFNLYVDYAHPTQQGKALISYVLYAYLTGDSPIGLPSLTLDEDEALLLQMIAWESHQSN